MKATDIIGFIEKKAPLSIAASWDASGVQVASRREEVDLVAVLLDPTPENLQHAVKAGAGFILAHHPLSMTPRFPNRCDTYLTVLSLLIKNDIWLYSAHTSLDANPDGPARWLAGELELGSVHTLDPVAGRTEAPAAPPLPMEEGVASPEYGFGFAGTLPGPMGYGDFCRKLARALGRLEWTGCGRRPETVSRVACCPGSGGSLLPAAVAAGADVYITGDLRYHLALDALNAGLRVLDVGHFILEEEMMRRFARQLDAALDVQVMFIPSRDPLAAEHAPSIM